MKPGRVIGGDEHEARQSAERILDDARAEATQLRQDAQRLATEIVSLARALVMIRVERDDNRELSEMYDLDGQYIPRTFFLTPAGEVRTELGGKNPSFRYFLDEHDPSELRALMQRALSPPPGRQLPARLTSGRPARMVGR